MSSSTAADVGGNRLMRSDTVEIGQCTLAGTRYGDLNQDRTMLRQMPAPSGAPDGACVWAAAVLDGHGMLGEFAAETAGRTVLDHLAAKLPATDLGDSSAGQRIMTKAFKAAHEAALQLYREPPEHYTYPKGSRAEDPYSLTYTEGLPMYRSDNSGAERLLEFGTTCTVAVLHQERVLLGNTGDSGAVLGSRQPDGVYAGEEITVKHWLSSKQELSTEREQQCPSSPTSIVIDAQGLNHEEAERIRSSKGGRVEILEQDGYLSVAAGRFKGYQLSMTRALGHNMLADFGVITSPSIVQRELQPDDSCLILASDGVWDVFSPSEAVDLVMYMTEEGSNAAAAAEQLCHEAVERSIDSEDGEADNTSAVVFVFKRGHQSHAGYETPTAS